MVEQKESLSRKLFQVSSAEVIQARGGGRWYVRAKFTDRDDVRLNGASKCCASLAREIQATFLST